MPMKVPVTLALRAELHRAQIQHHTERLALFVLGLGDEGDLPAWALACELAPDRVPHTLSDAAFTTLVGAVSLPHLVNTLHRAGERELSAALRSSDARSVPVVLLRDVERIVKALHDVESEEAELLLHARPAGSA